MSEKLIWIQRATEKYLTKRKARAIAAKAVKKTFKSELLSWLDAIVFAVVFVLLINQYLFQLFMIPSPSMVETLLIKDRVFVSKTSYGIEVYPGGPKIFDSVFPLRDEVIVFYNPEYESKGPVFDVLSQIIYMATFSLVNIDVDEMGNMRQRLYVKRATLTEGERAVFENGKLYIGLAASDQLIEEDGFRKESNLSVAPHQSLDPAMYKGINAYGKLLAYQDANISNYSPQHLLQEYKNIESYKGVVDYYQVDKSRSKTLKQIDPSNLSLRQAAARYQLGLYVPEGHVLPLGDNRDNSHDGRYFGPVPYKNIIGKVIFRFWPLGRMGGVS
jgi:signal peptidase I